MSTAGSGMVVGWCPGSGSGGTSWWDAGTVPTLRVVWPGPRVNSSGQRVNETAALGRLGHLPPQSDAFEGFPFFTKPQNRARFGSKGVKNSGQNRSKSTTTARCDHFSVPKMTENDHFFVIFVKTGQNQRPWQPLTADFVRNGRNDDF